jgi:sialate O-acetylesterase
LQQKSNQSFWGWAKPGEQVRIKVSWDTAKTYSVTVGNQGTWSIPIQTPAAGGPYSILVQGFNRIEITDVLIGEVWLGSGQSNMEWTPAMKINNAEAEKAAANYPAIRFFTVYPWASKGPESVIHGRWEVCTPESMFNFSAVMYFFGRELYRNLQQPIGLISSAWGGTPVEIWMPESVVNGDLLIRENAQLLKPVPWGPVEPGRAYNSMIHPLIPFRIRGALWYQGEANVANPSQYARSLKAMAESWRSAWGYEFPFYLVQIAPLKGYGKDHANGAMVRDQQRIFAETHPQTGIVVVSDIGDLDDIHPKNKQDVGLRLANLALYHDYGYTKVSYSGPVLDSVQVLKDRVLLQFRHAEGGLLVRGDVLTVFEVQEAGVWKLAAAKASGSVVTLDTRGLGKITGIRFAYRNDATPNLFNKAGLPASCFERLY